MFMRWQEFHIYELLLFLPVLDAQVSDNFDWDYSRKHGPSQWSKTYPKCGGDRQSPVHIETSKVWHSNSLTAFNMHSYETIPPHAHWGLHNSGHSMNLELQGEYILEEGALEGSYRAVELQFHWGSNDKRGAEHIIDDYVAPMELHLIHYNTKYSSVREAYMQPDGLAILAFLFNLSKRDNPAYIHIVNHLTNITHPGDAITLRPLPLLSLLPANLNNYYRYEGSTTTPPCAESAIWTIFANYISISSRQLDALRQTLKTSIRGDMERHMVDNYRPIQPLNGRTIYSSHPDHATVYSSPLSFPISVTLAAFCGIVLIILVFK